MVARGRRLGRGGALMLALLAAACGERPVTGPTASPVFAEGEARGVVVATRDARDRLVGQMPEAETAALVRALDTLAAALDAGDAAAARAALAAAEAELSELAAALPSWAPDLTAVALVLELAAPALTPRSTHPHWGRAMKQRIAAMVLGAVTATLAVVPVGAQQAPVVRHACYVPGTGTVYLIREPGTKQNCTAPGHVEFSFTDGAGALRPGDAAAGDLTGVLPAPTVRALQGRGVSNAAPADGAVLTWVDAAGRWEPKASSGGGSAGDHGALSGLTDDDHPQYLLLNGHRHTSGGGFAVSGTFGVGSVPVSGAGGRLMYATTASAFRVGSISAPFADGWDLPNLGIGSAAIGHNVRAMAQNSIVLGQNVHTTPAATGSIVIGINHDPFTLIGSVVPQQFLTHAPGGIVMQTSPGSRCEMKPGSGSWDCSSDAAGKADFEEIDAEAVLSRVARLPITRWRYSGEPDSVRHLGPTAQDFRAAFGLGAGDRHIGVLDAAGVSLAAGKALAARTDALAATDAAFVSDVATLRAELAQLRAAYATLLDRVAALEAAPRR